MKLLMVVVLVVVGACHSNSEVDEIKGLIKKYKPQVQAKIEQLQRLYETLPNTPLPTTNPRLDPPIEFRRQLNLRAIGNTAIRDYEDLKSDDGGGAVDLGVDGGDLVVALQLGNYAYSPSAERLKPADYREIFEHGLATRYLIVHRTIAHADPKFHGVINQFEAGADLIRGYVVDLSTSEVVAGFDVVAQTPEKMQIQYNPKVHDQGKDIRAMEALNQALWKDGREQFKRALIEKIGGTFVFDL